MRILLPAIATPPIAEISLMTTKEFKYEETARRKPVNLTVNQDLLASARKYKLNLSKILEDALISELKTRWQNDWLNENKAAISAYNKRIAKHGVFSDGVRRF
jgi:antitoxin CcdA